LRNDGLREKDADAILNSLRGCTKLEHLTWFTEGLNPIGKPVTGPYPVPTYMCFYWYNKRL
jgi:hypothetical protein